MSENTTLTVRLPKVEKDAFKSSALTFVSVFHASVNLIFSAVQS
jgi:hypothetical protein